MTDPAKVTLCAVGDMMPRFPEEPEKTYRVFDLSAPVLRNADIAFGQVEAVLSGNVETAHHAAIINPAKVKFAKILADAGFNMISASGNHHMNAGTAAFIDTINEIKQAGILPVGMGMNIAEARTPAVVERKGVKVAVLGYSSILQRGELPSEARTTTPGCTPIHISTYYEATDWQAGMAPNVITVAQKEDLTAMIGDIKKAKAQADVVMVSMHWGLHFVPATIADYEYEVGHAAIDAGADLIVGHHAHIVKGIEVYKGKVIFHCLGNFSLTPSRRKFAPGDKFDPDNLWQDPVLRLRVPDPEWKDYSFLPDFRKSMIAKCVISTKTKKIESVSFLPCMINQNVQPEPLSRDDKRSDEVFEYVQWASRSQGMDTHFVRQGDEVVVLT
jgi:poly-gamma-glutamate capsule biosynthesis protein CapA/YwtB (metallophosphatase superfamily)